MNAEALIAALSLKPHPEGGFYAETYRSPETVTARAGPRSASTAIYFLLPAGAASRFHRIRSDELWHFHLGGPLTVVELSPDGRLTETVLGPAVDRGQKLQHAVPAGAWFGAFPNPGTAFALVGCTVAPGFDFADFELAERAALVREFPAHRAVIERLT